VSAEPGEDQSPRRSEGRPRLHLGPDQLAPQGPRQPPRLHLHLRRHLPRARRCRRHDPALRQRLFEQYADHYPHEFSGGQRQRIGIARAFIMEPTFLVADEPVSAPDVSIRAQVVNLLMDIKKRLDLTILLISHNLAVVGHVCDRVAVMYLGRIVEIAETRTLFRNPATPMPKPCFLLFPSPTRPDPTRHRERILLKSDLPSPLAPPSGCAFRTRCRYALPAYAEPVPPLVDVGDGHQKACTRDDIELHSAMS